MNMNIQAPEFTRNELNYSVLNLFFIPPEMKLALDTYSQIRMNGKQFSKELIEGCLIRNNLSYQVIYSSCTPFAARKARELKLSFRKAKSVFNIPPTVIVKIVVDMDGIKEEN